MNARLFLILATAAAIAGPAGAQQRRANMVGGASGGAGRCVAEVVVDGSAELQVRGDTANLRDVSGRPPQWRRFECTSPIPANADVRLSANGRGRTQLIASPRNGGSAVVRIEDPEGGAQDYQVELSWNTGQGYQGDNRGYQGNPASDDQRYDRNAQSQGRSDRDRDDRDRDDRDRGGRFTADQAIQVCRDAIRDQAMNRFGTRDINFGRINIDDNPGRRDWVVGTVSVGRGRRDEQYPFSCSVNFDNGRVRSAQINAPNNMGYAGREMGGQAVDRCRDAVANRIGGDRVEFGSINTDERGDNQLVRGTARTRGRNYEFSCSVNPYNGNVRDVDVRPR